MAYYDYDQVRCDISLVARAFGERVTEGFYSITRYRSGPYELVDRMGVPSLRYKGNEVHLRTLSPTLGIGKWLINKAIQLEEVSPHGSTAYRTEVRIDV
jgi:hypothetical protein